MVLRPFRHPRALSVLFFILFLYFGCSRPSSSPREDAPSVRSADLRDDALLIQRAFQEKRSDLFVQSQGEVVKVLTDDVKLPRHQRFIIRLPHGQTLLVTHNIDIAPRIERLKTGDSVSFRGEYEYNDKGGVIHWTHHDPVYRRNGGWIIHEGKKYE